MIGDTLVRHRFLAGCHPLLGLEKALSTCPNVDRWFVDQATSRDVPFAQHQDKSNGCRRSRTNRSASNIMSSLINPVTISATASGSESSKPISQVQPYLFFEGRCEEALEYYRQTLGAEVLALMRFKDGPPDQDAAACGPGMADKVMHANFRIGDTTLMASDGRCEQPVGFQGFSLSITASSDAEAERFFTALAESGQVQMPLAKTFFASRFGMVADRFGVSWMVVSGAATG